MARGVISRAARDRSTDRAVCGGTWIRNAAHAACAKGIQTMLAITYQRQLLNGAFSADPDPAAVDFHDAAVSHGLTITSSSDGKTLRVTGDPRTLADFYRDITLSEIDATVTQEDGDADAADIFRAALGDLGAGTRITTAE
jgi:hypothetical protein